MADVPPGKAGERVRSTSVFALNDDDMQTLQQAIADAGDKAGSIIDRYLHDTGGATIEAKITARLPVSGRRWKGKKTAAKQAKPFRQKFEPLKVTTTTQKNYHYLYFPDDGSSTVHHIGGQHFMLHGAEDARESIVDGILSQLTAAI